MENIKKTQVLFDLINEILIEYLPHISAIIEKFKHNTNQIAIFLFYQKTSDKLKEVLEYILEIFLREIKKKKSPNKKENSFFNEIEEKILFNKFSFYDLEDINIKTTLELLEKIKKMVFLPIVEIVQEKTSNDLKILKTILISTRKLDFLLNHINEIVTFSKEDLFGIFKEERKKDKNWIELGDNFKKIRTGSKKDLKIASDKINDIFYAVQAAYILSRKSLLNLENHESLQNIIRNDEEEEIFKNNSKKDDKKGKPGITKSVLTRKFWTNTFHYLLKNNKKDSKMVVELFNAFPKIQTVQEIWNLTEVNFIKTMRKMTLMKIGTNCKFYIYPELFHSFFPNKSKSSEFSKFIYISEEKPLDLSFDVLLDKNILNKNKNRISIRLLCHSKILIKNLIKEKYSEFNKMKKDISSQKFEKKVDQVDEEILEQNKKNEIKELQVSENLSISNSDDKNKNEEKKEDIITQNQLKENEYNLDLKKNEIKENIDNTKNDKKEEKLEDNDKKKEVDNENNVKESESNFLTQKENLIETGNLKKKDFDFPKNKSELTAESLFNLGVKEESLFNLENENLGGKEEILKKVNMINETKNSSRANIKETGNFSIFKNIIIHIHGGGFISSSSSYHQSNLKRILNKNGDEFKLSYFCDRLPTSPSS